MTDDLNAYRQVLEDLRARCEEIERRIGALQGEKAALSAAIAAMTPLANADTPLVTRTDRIEVFVRAAAKWLTHSEIVHGLCPDRGSAYSRDRHTIRTQVGQLVQRGRLRQAGRLIGMPDWQPPLLAPMDIGMVSGRNGRKTKIALVLKDAGRPLHVKEVCAEMIRRDWDGDERCVATALSMEWQRVQPRWRKVAPATFEWINTEPVPESIQ